MTGTLRSGISTSGSNKFEHIFIFWKPATTDRDKTFLEKNFFILFLWVPSCQIDSLSEREWRPCELNYSCAKFLLFWYFPWKRTRLANIFQNPPTFWHYHFFFTTNFPLKVWAKFLSVCKEGKVESFHPRKVLYLAV